MKISNITLSDYQKKRAEYYVPEDSDSLRKLEIIYKTCPVISFIWKVGDRWPVEWISANISQFGYSSEAFMNGDLDYADIIYPKDYEKIVIEVNKLINKPETPYFTLVYRILTKSGEIKSVIERSIVIRDKDGNITHFQGIIIDNTKNELLNSSLKRIELKYGLIFETAPMGIICFDENGIIVNCNKKCLVILNEDNSIVGLNILKYITNNQLKAAIDIIFLGETGFYEGEFIQVTGGKLFIRAKFLPLMSEDGSLLGGVGIVENITEQQKNEEQIRLNESRLETLLQLYQRSHSSISQIIEFTLEKATLLTHSETGYLNIFNEDNNNLELYQWSINSNHQDKIISSIRSTGIWGEAIRERVPLINNNLSDFNINREIIPGLSVPINSYLSIPIINEEQIVAVAFLINKNDDYDNSDLKQTSLLFDGMWKIIKLQQSQEKLIGTQSMLEVMKLVVNDSPAIVFMWSPEKDWPVKFVSDNITKYGYSVEDFASGKIIYGNIIHPDDVEKVRNEVNRCYTEGYSDYSQEYRIVTKSGEIRWIDERTLIHRNAQGNLDYLQGIVVDITENKQSNVFTHIESDFQNNEYLKTNIEFAFDKILDFSLQIKAIDCGAIYIVDDESENFDMIVQKGYSDVFIEKFGHFGSNTIQARLFKTGYPVYKHFSEISLMLKENMDYEEKLQAMGFIPVQNNEKLIGAIILGSHHELEITADSRNVIDTIANQLKAIICRFKSGKNNSNANINNKFEEFFNSTDDLVFVMNMSGLIIYVNNAVLKNLKYGLKKILKMDFLELFPPEREKDVLVSINLEHIMDGATSRCYVPLIDKDNNLISADTKFFIAKWDGEEALIGISRLNSSTFE